MGVQTLIAVIRKANEAEKPWCFNPDTGEFRCQWGCAVTLVADYDRRHDKTTWEKTLWSLNLQIEESEEMVFFSGREASSISEVLWDLGQGHDSERAWQEGFTEFIFGFTRNLVEFQGSLTDFDLDLAYSGTNWGLITVPRKLSLRGKEVMKAAADGMLPLLRFRESTLTILAFQFCQVWRYETFQGVFSVYGELFQRETAAKLAAVLIAFNGIRIHHELLLRELLPAFRARIAVMARGTAATEWPDFQDHDLQDETVLMMGHEEIAWVIRSD